MNVVMNYDKKTGGFLQIGMFPEYRDGMAISSLQVRASGNSIKNITKMLANFYEKLSSIIEDGIGEGESWKEETFHNGYSQYISRDVMLFVTHSHHRVCIYCNGQCLEMSVQGLGELVKQLEKVK